MPPACSRVLFVGLPPSAGRWPWHCRRYSYRLRGVTASRPPYDIGALTRRIPMPPHVPRPPAMGPRGCGRAGDGHARRLTEHVRQRQDTEPAHDEPGQAPCRSPPDLTRSSLPGDPLNDQDNARHRETVSPKPGTWPLENPAARPRELSGTRQRTAGLRPADVAAHIRPYGPRIARTRVPKPVAWRRPYRKRRTLPTAQKNPDFMICPTTLRPWTMPWQPRDRPGFVRERRPRPARPGMASDDETRLVPRWHKTRTPLREPGRVRHESVRKVPRTKIADFMRIRTENCTKNRHADFVLRAGEKRIT